MDVPEGYIAHRYWNTGGRGICIAAFKGVVDWAAYINADDGQSEEACLIVTIREGCKLFEKDAQALFPNVETSYRH